MPKYNWPLATNTFTYWDRIKIALFFLNKSNRWTQDKYVREYERKIADYVGAQYAVFVSSGSAANQLIAQYIKDDLVKNGQWEKRNKVVLSAVSWQTNASVWIREGFEPIFVDIQLEDFAMDNDQLKLVLDMRGEEIACVFPTAVLGYTPNIHHYKRLQKAYGVRFCLDSCENFFGKAVSSRYQFVEERHNGNINSWLTCSTSGYLAHQINSGGESGIIFTNDKEEYLYFLLARAHGLSRNLKPYAQSTIFVGSPPWPDMNSYYPWEYEPIYNPLVDQEFNFALLSSNYRNTDIAAYCSLLDLKRADENRAHRVKIYNHFSNNLDPLRYYLPMPRPDTEDVAFCLPIVTKGEGKEKRIEAVRKYAAENGIEIRAFISGNMLRQTPYKQYADYKDFPVAEYITQCGSYIGLSATTTIEDIDRLVADLNKL